MKHRPEYIAVSSPYVRPALYAPPAAPSQADLDAQDAAALANPISRWAASWRSLAYLVGVLVALAVLIGAGAYGVITIRRSYVPQHRTSTWVTPTTYGAPGPNGGPR